MVQHETDKLLLLYKDQFRPRPLIGRATGTVGRATIGLILGLTGGMVAMGYQKEIAGLFEESAASEKELISLKLIENQADLLVETIDNATSSLETLTNEWSALQSNVQITMSDIHNENVNELKIQFEEASIAWENTQNVSEFYQQLEENEIDSIEDPIEIDFDEIINEEDLEETMKEIYDLDELIDISDLTDEELEELSRDLVEYKLDEAV